MIAIARLPQAQTETRGVEPDGGLLATILSRMDAMTVQQSRPSPIHLRTWAEIERFAEKAAFSNMVPNDFKGKPDAICIAIQLGSEIGLPPMQALANIAVINGRPTIWGDAMAALCRASGKLHYIKEWVEGAGDDKTWYCEALRKDDPNPIQQSFSVRQAKAAKLWGKAGPWTEYTDRMGQMRARSFCLRDACPDVLKGLIAREEAADIPFEATGLQLAPAPAPQPATTPKATLGEWITGGFSTLLAECETLGDLEKLQGGAHYAKAARVGTDDEKHTMNAMILDAMARIEIVTGVAVEPDAPTEDDDDVFPGDK